MNIFLEPIEISEDELLELENMLSTLLVKQMFEEIKFEEIKPEEKEDAVRDLITNLIRRILIYEIRLKKAKNILDTLNSQLNEKIKIEAEYNQIKPECEVLKSKLETLKSEKDAITEMYNKLEFEYQSTKRKHAEEVNAIKLHYERQIDDLTVRIDELINSIKQKDSEIKTLNETISTLNKEIETLRSEKDKLTSKIAELMVKDETSKHGTSKRYKKGESG
jgi:predicted  nucleic acid-binding Zn-ribbon protein